MDNQIIKFINLQDEVLHAGELGLLCNQTSYDFQNGKYLFEGTILSEGRGTVKPFEIIGAPFIEWNELKK